MKIYDNSVKIVEAFKHIEKIDISDNKDDGSIDLFLFPVNGRNFDYDSISNLLVESVADYALSRATKKNYDKNYMTISKKARETFRNIKDNQGELGELLLFCFLEGYLQAPKILTKLELKSSNELYVNGADGVHLKKISDTKYHLIFGESKTYQNLSNAFRKAFESISSFKYGTNKEKKGIMFERTLITKHLESDKEVFNEEEQHIIQALIYPQKLQNSQNTQELTIRLDNAFSIFVGYEVNISDEVKKYNDTEFSETIELKIKTQIMKYKNTIYKLMEKYDLIGNTFYIFIVPFTDIELKRTEILKEILS